MGTYLISVGHHKLKDIDNIENVARQLSDIYDVNIEWGFNDEEFNYTARGRVTKHPGEPYFLLEEYFDETKPCFQLMGSIDKTNKVDSLVIHRELVEMEFDSWPYQFFNYKSCFEKDSPVMDVDTAELLRDFRVRCRNAFAKLGVTKVFGFCDRGEAGFLGNDPMNMSGSDFEDYILSGRYLDDAERIEKCVLKPISKVVNVPDFVTGKDKTRVARIVVGRNPTLVKDGADVFVDDFSDL